MQPEFTSAILGLCREKGVNTAIETSGFALWDKAKSVYELCDLVLHDIKQMKCKKTYASADGRRFGEILSDGSVSPEHGCDFNGPLAVMTSAMKIDQSRYNATLMNLKFHPSALKTEEDLMKLASMTKIVQDEVIERTGFETV